MFSYHLDRYRRGFLNSCVVLVHSIARPVRTGILLVIAYILVLRQTSNVDVYAGSKMQNVQREPPQEKKRRVWRTQRKNPRTSKTQTVLFYKGALVEKAVKFQNTTYATAPYVIRRCTST